MRVPAGCARQGGLSSTSSPPYPPVFPSIVESVDVLTSSGCWSRAGKPLQEQCIESSSVPFPEEPGMDGGLRQPSGLGCLCWQRSFLSVLVSC